MYVTRFNKEVLQVEKVDDQVLLTAFQVGLRLEDFLFSIAKNPPATMADLLFKLQKYMNVEYVVASKGITKCHTQGGSYCLTNMDGIDLPHS